MGALRRQAATAAALLLALGALGCASSPYTPHETGNLFLWRVERNEVGGVAYLMGSVHLARPDTELDPAVYAAFDRAETLVVEVDLREVDAARTSALLVSLGLLPPGNSLENLVSRATWRRFAELLQRNGQSVESYAPFEPWVAFTVATALLLEESDLRIALGIDRLFLERVGDEGEVISLETLEFQLSLFDQIPLELQARMLSELLAEEGSAARDASAMIEAWRLGDTDALERMIAASFASDPDLADLQRSLFAERNRRMTERIDELLRSNRRLFVVVGAGHMVGFQGIPSLLQARGYRVEQVSKTP